MEDINIMRRAYWSIRLVLVLFSFAIMSGALGTNRAYAIYDVPSDRRITWSAGLDSSGGIPNYTSVTCTGLDPSGTIDNTAQIQTCITIAAAGTAVFIPAGTYRVDGTITMKSNVVLRGAKAAVAPWLPAADGSATTLNMNGGGIDFNGGEKWTNWNPAAPNGTSITAGYAQGSSGITVSDASVYAVGDYISIYQDQDPTIVSDFETYLGEDCGACPDRHVLQQYSQITGQSGNTLTIDPPIYYVTPIPLNPKIRKQTFGVISAGLENLRLNGNGTNTRIIRFHFALNCWTKGVETYNVGADPSGSPHIWTDFSYGNEYRDGYHHHGAGNDGGENFGIQFINWNSRHKIENNIVRDTRHAIVFAGGSGNAILFNYTDDNWESVPGAPTTPKTDFISEDETPNHGAHPYMNLWEGNSATSFGADYVHGSSSHNTLFKNFVRCIRTTMPLTNPWSWDCVHIEQYSRYYNFVGNVVGQSSFTTGTVVSNSANSDPLPIMFSFGRSGYGGVYADTLPFSTAIKHGNYDYITQGVAYWDGGADHTLLNSMYYNAKPSFFGTCPWPPFGPEGNPTINTLPAQDRYAGGSSCGP